MKKQLALILALTMLTLAGCGTQPVETTPDTIPTETFPAPTAAPTESEIQKEITSQIVDIVLDGQNITVDGEAAAEEGDVYISRDIVYYEEKTQYESGNPYGEGGKDDMHTAEEAEAHLVVNITAPGTYRLSGTLDLGQIRVDLGEEAYEDPNAVVNLILNGVDITCTVAPAILFRNVYECDGNWSVDTASPDVDTTAAGANLVLAEGSENTVTGSYVAKIFKDKEGEKKLWKQDGAIYSYMSMNVFGPGSLDLSADNEGMDTELHLTIHGGDINIRSGNDGINTNEDGVSVTTICGGNIHIIAGLGEEGDGIDSNGYLVIRGGTVVASANPAADAGLDSDLGSYIHGGTVIALGSTMDWAESDSDQVTMNLQFAKQQSVGSSIVIAREDGTVMFAYDPGQDEVLGENVRTYMSAVISCPHFLVGDSYEVFIAAEISGNETGGVYDVTTVSGFTGGVQMAYTGTDVMMGPGQMGDFGGQRPEMNVTPPEDMPEPPEADYTIPSQPEGDMPMMPQGSQQPPDGMGEPPEGETRPEGDWTMPEGEWTMPEGEMPSMPEGEMPSMPDGQTPPNGFGSFGDQSGESRTLFYMQDKVNFFSGLTEVE